MKSTFRMMGIADYITLCNGLLGVSAILFLILAVNDFSDPYQDGIKSQYVWASVICILLSAIGDTIDGPIARRYSKVRFLGGNLDIMSDSISFTVAPSLLIFVMYGRMGSATPFWTLLLGMSCCWVVATGMMRLARFAYEEGGDYSYFLGISTPVNALFLLSISTLIWLQPSSGFGPELSTWDCTNFCFGRGEPHPYFDFLIVPAMLVSGSLMISERKMSKLKNSPGNYLGLLAITSIFLSSILQFRHTLGGVGDYEETANFGTFFMLIITLLLTIIYFITGPKISEKENSIIVRSESE